MKPIEGKGRGEVLQIITSSFAWYCRFDLSFLSTDHYQNSAVASLLTLGVVATVLGRYPRPDSYSP